MSRNVITGGVGVFWATIKGYLNDNFSELYGLFTGAAGGQTIIGGENAGDALKLQGTAGNGTATSPAVQTLVGNNGNVVAETTLNNGNKGFGVVDPSAVVHIKAGTTAAGTAPLKLSSGVLLTAPEDGTLEHANGRFYITGTNRRAISRAGDILVESTTVANTAAETTIYTATLVANTMSAGKVYRLSCLGMFSTANASSSVTVKVKIGSTVISSATTSLGVVSDKPWHTYISVTCRTAGAAGTVAVHGDTEFNTDFLHTCVESATINTEVQSAFTVTVQWNSANSGNTIGVHQGYLEVFG